MGDFWSDLTGGRVHTGSAGLPDFGASERLAGWLGTAPSNNGTGGSDLFLNNPNGSNSTQLNVLGNQSYQANQNYLQQQTPLTDKSGKNAQTGGGGTTTTNNNNNTIVPQGESEETRRAREEAEKYKSQMFNNINSGYDEYVKNLLGMQGGFTTAQDEEVGSASKIYDTIFGGLTEQKQANIDKLEAGRGQVNQREVQSIKDLTQNLNNTVRGMSMQMGALGAGDTSATKVMMPYAYTKIAGQQEGGIRRQANDQMFQIDQEQRNTELEFSKMWKDTEVEKESRIGEIKRYFGDMIRNVQAAIAQAPLDKQKDLAALNQSLLSEAQANLRSLEADTRKTRENIKSWATQRLSALNDAKIQLSGKANFSPQDIVFQELQMLNAPEVVGQAANYDWNPMLNAKKVREQYFA